MIPFTPGIQGSHIWRKSRMVVVGDCAKEKMELPFTGYNVGEDEKVLEIAGNDHSQQLDTHNITELYTKKW